MHIYGIPYEIYYLICVHPHMRKQQDPELIPSKSDLLFFQES